MIVKFSSNDDTFGAFSLGDLTNGKLYQVVEENKGMYRVIDDSGNPYFYPASYFEVINSPVAEDMS